MASLLDKEFLEQLEYLYIVAKSNQSLHSKRVSRKFGVGLEYADHRDYAPSDDFRYIDWQVFMRLDRLVIKLFSEEQELTVYLLLDASASMARGRPQKLLVAKQVLAALGYIGMSNLDRVTVVPFRDELDQDSPTLTGLGHRLELLRFLEAVPGRGRTDLGRCVRAFVNRYKRRGLVVLATDFLDPSYPAALRLLHHHGFDCLAVQVNDRREIDPTQQGDVELVDCESGEHVSVRMTPQVIAEYVRERSHHYAELSRLCRGFRQGHYAIVNDHPVREFVVDIFRRSGFLR